MRLTNDHSGCHEREANARAVSFCVTLKHDCDHAGFACLLAPRPTS